MNFEGEQRHRLDRDFDLEISLVTARSIESRRRVPGGPMLTIDHEGRSRGTIRGRPQSDGATDGLRTGRAK